MKKLLIFALAIASVGLAEAGYSQHKGKSHHPSHHSHANPKKLSVTTPDGRTLKCSGNPKEKDQGRAEVLKCLREGNGDRACGC